MEYSCQNFKNGNVLTAECLNHIEEGIQHVCETMDCLCGDGQPKKLSEYVEGVVESKTPSEVANALKGTASGATVAITDVSPVAHEMGVTVKSKNILDVANAPMFGNWHPNNTKNWNYERTETGLKYNILTDTNMGYACLKYAICSVDDVRGKNVTVSFNRTGREGVKEAYFILAVGDTEFTAGYTYKGNGAENEKNLGGLNYNHLVNGYGKCTITIPASETRKYLYALFYVACATDMVAGDVIEYSNIQVEINDTATAYAPYIEDVSAVKVIKCGKNLVDTELMVSNPSSYAWKYNEETGRWARKKNAGGASQSFFQNANGQSQPRDITRLIKVPANTSLCVTFFDCVYSDEASPISIGFYDYTGTRVGTYNFKNYSATTKGTPLTPDLDEVWMDIQLINATSDLTFSGVQVEVGDVGTEFETYTSSTYTPDAEGAVKGIMSNGKAITLYTDTAGALLDCTYNKDANKVIGSLLERIAALEAAVL